MTKGAKRTKASKTKVKKVYIFSPQFDFPFDFFNFPNVGKLYIIHLKSQVNH